LFKNIAGNIISYPILIDVPYANPNNAPVIGANAARVIADTTSFYQLSQILLHFLNKKWG
jgi:hypothetical protein